MGGYDREGYIWNADSKKWTINMSRNIINEGLIGEDYGDPKVDGKGFRERFQEWQRSMATPKEGQDKRESPWNQWYKDHVSIPSKAFSSNERTILAQSLAIPPYNFIPDKWLNSQPELTIDIKNREIKKEESTIKILGKGERRMKG
jgi:hypothetical protein